MRCWSRAINATDHWLCKSRPHNNRQQTQFVWGWLWRRLTHTGKRRDARKGSNYGTGTTAGTQLLRPVSIVPYSTVQYGSTPVSREVKFRLPPFCCASDSARPRNRRPGDERTVFCSTSFAPRHWYGTSGKPIMRIHLRPTVGARTVAIRCWSSTNRWLCRNVYGSV